MICVQLCFVRKSDTPVIPADDWEQFMASQMKQQTRVAKTGKQLGFIFLFLSCTAFYCGLS